MSDFLQLMDSEDRRTRLAAVNALDELTDERVIYCLIDHLADSYWPVREASARQLLRLDSQVLEYLDPCLESANADIKFWAGRILAMQRSEPALEMLLGAFARTEDNEDHRHIANALVEADRAALPVLIRGCQSPSIPVRMGSAQCLGSLKAGEARETLEELLGDPSWAVRRHAVTALGAIADRRSLELLIGALDDESWNVRVAATEALGRFRHMIRAVDNRSDRQSEAELPEILMDRIQQALSDEDPAVKEAGIAVLGSIGLPDAVNPLADVFRDSRSEDLKRLVIRSIARIDAVEAGIFLRETLTNMDSPLLRTEILRGLINHPGDVSIAELDTSLAADSTEEVQAAIELAIRLDRPDIITHLAPLTAIPDTRLRIHLAERLGESRVADGRPYLYILSEDPDAEVRRAALSSLVQRGGIDVTSDVIEFLRDPAGIVRREALGALIRHGDGDALHPLLNLLNQEGSRNTRYMAIQALAAIGDTAHPHLLNILATGDRDLRFWTIETLAGFDSPATIEALRGVLQQESDPELIDAALHSLAGMDIRLENELIDRIAAMPGVRPARLVEVIGRRPDRDRLPKLMEFLHSKDVEARFRAIQAISRVPDLNDETLAMLTSLLSDRSWPVRKAASDALGRLGERIFELLAALFKKERRHPDEIFWGVRTLGKLRHGGAVSLLAAEFTTAEGPLREEVVKSLGRINTESAQQHLVEFLSSDDRQIRFHAAKGLKSASAAAFRPHLIRALADENENVRYWIAITLGNYDGEDVEQALNGRLEDSSHWVRKYASDSLDRIRRKKS